MTRRMRFGTWCKKDPDDERKINYKFTDADGHVQYFTSEDVVSLKMIRRIYNAWIGTVVSDNNEWYVDIYED